MAEIGLVFQDDNLIPELTASENIELPLAALGLTRQESRSQALDSLARVGIAELVDRRPSEMSGGQRQRVGIARALTGGRRLILADEPTGALDSRTSRQLYELLAELASDGMAVVMVSHDPAAEGYATRVATMLDSRLTQS